MNSKKGFALKRFIPLIILLIGIALIYLLGLNDYIRFQKLKEQRENLKYFVHSYPFLSVLSYILFYMLVVMFSLPIGAFVSVLGGFLFTQPWSTVYAVIGATTGASLIFLIARTSIGHFLKEKAGPSLQKIEKGIQENEKSYLLFLRLVPLFPFWLINIAPAFFNVSFPTFLWTTAVGIIPGAFVYTQAGAGIGEIIDSGKKFTLEGVFNWKLRIALIGIGLFALLPIVIKKIRKRKKT